MAARRRRTENPSGRGAASEVVPETESTAMDRFKRLTRRLLTVSREELAVEQRKAAETKARRRQQSG
jgi:hypothetical protein